MNRLHLVALAAALSTFALACEENRTEIYEPAPPAAVSDSEQIDTTGAKVTDDLDLNFPVPAAADEPIDLVAIETIDNVDMINGGIVNPSTLLPPVYDPTRIEQVNADGTITMSPDEVIDPHDITYVPGLGLNPLLQIDAPPSRANAQTQIEGLPPLGE